MLVRDAMNADVEPCGPTDNLATVAGIMWRNDCGVVPVLGDGRRVIGLITDRDICMAAATRDRLAREITVADVCAWQVHACAPQDDVRSALKTMEEHQVRRLPVIDRESGLVGMLSLHDIVRRATATRGRGGAGISHEDVMGALKALAEDPVGAATR
jgi:CBS domain-containing protein